MEEDAPRLALVIDYQNIHLTARDLFAPYGTPVHEVLIHPLRFAEQMLAERAERQMDPRQQGAVLADVFVFRGQPSNQHQPDLYRITQAQKAEWERDRRVHVHYRTLRYAPNRPPQEKGIDVLVALNLVRLVDSGEYDVVVLAAHDTDLEPALEMAASRGRAKVETCGWAGGRRLRIPQAPLWHTALPAGRLVASRDRRGYR